MPAASSILDPFHKRSHAHMLCGVPRLRRQARPVHFGLGQEGGAHLAHMWCLPSSA